MSVLKIEAFSGLSGDMFLGALASLTGEYEILQKLPAMLHLEKEAAVEFNDMNKNGIVCRHVKIIGRSQHHDHPYVQVSGHSRDHRHLSEINSLIDKSEIPVHAKNTARKIFLLLGKAESRVHGIPLEKIHFHEVGAIDSIMDIVGTAVLLERLRISKTYCTPVTTGSGFVMTAHGKLPVPTPATQYLLEGIPVQSGEVDSEMATPTGAAILKFLEPEFDMPVLIAEKTGYGPAEKNFGIPNVLRISLCKESMKAGEIVVLETNIDDMSGEFLGTEFQEKLFDLGALDFFYQQIIMKKGRPGLVLTVLIRYENLERVVRYIFDNTTSIGVRYYPANRFELERKIKQADTTYGKVTVKETLMPGNKKRIKPESSDIIRIATKENKSPVEILKQVMKDIEEDSDPR